MLHLSRCEEKPGKALYLEVHTPRRTTNSAKACLFSEDALTKIPGTGSLSNINLFFTWIGAGTPRIRVPAWSGSAEKPLPSLQLAVFLIHPHVAEDRERKQVLLCLL